MKRETKKAFNWIIKILQKYNVLFEITGGLAARVYGSKRKLEDIDIEMPNRFFDVIMPAIREHVVYGPKRYCDNSFDLFLVTLKYKGQLIDISGSSDEKIYNKKIKAWTKEKVNYSKTVLKKIFSHFVPVISKTELVKYKSRISRKVDKKDLEYLKR